MRAHWTIHSVCTVPPQAGTFLQSQICMKRNNNKNQTTKIKFEIKNEKRRNTNEVKRYRYLG